MSSLPPPKPSGPQGSAPGHTQTHAGDDAHSPGDSDLRSANPVQIDAIRCQPQPELSIEKQQLDALLTGALEQYRTLLDAGHIPQRGAFLARYPAIAAELDECLAALEFVHAAAPELSSAGSRTAALQRDAAAAAAEQNHTASALGDFRILRELGRGGMGIVYEAEQLSLGRRVAVKVLPFAGALDSRQLERFKHEARAAAQLHHANIVPVFFVGCERGVHFYAMQLIEGTTLARLIARLREGLCQSPTAGGSPQLHSSSQPACDPDGASDETLALAAAADSTLNPKDQRGFFRTIARLGAQIADALDHAHSLAVVHRDIKPSNLLLDHQGKLWVTDFGLALVPADATLTMSGDLLGTLRYMSPEQAQGDRALVDHRTDVYSLGATLYELLTLQPAFAGRSREVLFRQIASHDPRPARRVNPAVPAELEIIVAKAMAKAPQDRYRTAGELADDLARYLDDKPILARPPTPVQRVRKWARRHTPLVVSATVCAAALLISAVAALAISNRLIRHEKGRAERALADARASGRRADRERARAEANFQMALGAVDQMLTRVSEESLSYVPRTAEVRRELLQDALTFYQGFLRQKGDDRTVRHETARAYARVGAIHGALGQSDQAQAAYMQALALADELSADDPGSDDFQLLQYQFQSDLAGVLRATPGKEQEAEALYRNAVAICQRVAANSPSPSHQARLAGAHHRLGYLLWEVGRTAEAESVYHDALAIQRKTTAEHPANSSTLAGMYNSLGILLRLDGRPAEAELEHREALRLFDAIHPPGDSLLGIEQERARTFGHLALALRRLGRGAEAESSLRQAIGLREKLSREWPSSQGDHYELALNRFSLGMLLADAGRADEAEASFRSSIAGLEELLGEYPNLPRCREHLAQSVAGLAGVLHAASRQSESDARYQQAIDLLQLEIDRVPKAASAHNTLAWLLATCPDRRWRDAAAAVDHAQQAIELEPQQGGYWNTLGIACYRAGDWKSAREALTESLHRTPRGDGSTFFFLAMTACQSGDRDQAQAWRDRAVAWCRDNKPDDAELQRFAQEAEALSTGVE